MPDIYRYAPAAAMALHSGGRLSYGVVSQSCSTALFMSSTSAFGGLERPAATESPAIVSAVGRTRSLGSGGARARSTV